MRIFESRYEFCYDIRRIRVIVMLTMRPLILTLYACLACARNIDFSCPTRPEQVGVCTVPYACPSHPYHTKSYKHAKNDKCSGNLLLNRTMVCCAVENVVMRPLNMTEDESGQDEIIANPAHRDYVKRKILPKPKICGNQQNEDRLTLRNFTELDEFPWLVHVSTVFNMSSCPGILIARRYVLTNILCGWSSSSVRLGLYRPNETVTCFDNDNQFYDDCNEVVVEIKAVPIRSSFNYEVSLLLLDEDVYYSSYVRPICLPIENSSMPEMFDIVSTSGWAEDNFDFNNPKKKYALQLIEDERCDHQFFDFASFKYRLFCGIPRHNESMLTCFGDSGGPIMYKKGLYWYLTGIMLDPQRMPVGSKCFDDIPVYGFKVTEDLLNWILDNMK